MKQSKKMIEQTLPTPSILLAVDTLVIAVNDGRLRVLLVERTGSTPPLRVIPGGFVESDETCLQAAKRKLQEETGYSSFSIHPIGIFDDITRDSRARVISYAHIALTHKTSFPFHDGLYTSHATFFPITALPQNIGYDHRHIITSAITYLQDVIMHTSIAKALLPKDFTLAQLQSVYETIIGKTLNTRNFRTKLIDEWIIKATGKMEIGVGHRPAQYYRFG
jgi:8-oxo-dGTP diphosphatase